MPYKISYYCASHNGHVRSNNEDNIVYGKSYLPEGHNGTLGIINGTVSSDDNLVFGVFDGLGGEACGEVASLIAAKNFSQHNYKNTKEDLRHICHKSLGEILDYGNEKCLYSIGTTVAVLLFGKERITLCNIGDSKIYHIHHGEICQISMDHVYSFSDKGKPALYQCLGTMDEDTVLDPYFDEIEYDDGDIFIIASDGVTDALSAMELQNILVGNSLSYKGESESENTKTMRYHTNFKGCAEISESILLEALERFGKDNTSFVILFVER